MAKSSVAGTPNWAELEKLPIVPISLSPFQERLLKGAVILERRQFNPRGAEPAREVRLWRTSFKYPLVREEVWLRADDKGRKLPVRREFSIADHAMVQFPADATAEMISAWTKRHGFHVRQTLKTATVHLVAADNGTLSTADTIMSAFRQAFPLAADAHGTAERDYLVFPTLFPTDTSFSQLWGLHNTGQTGGTADADIDASEAWDITTGSRDIVVGVIDTGVDRTHPDLAANMWTNPHEIPGNSVDDDGNGFVDDINGWDFFANDNNPMDEEGHGTHCAGTIGGVGNNLTGVTGVCWQVSIVGIRFLGPSGGTTSDAIECVNYARDLGVDLTSNSWGGGGFSGLLQTAIASSGAADQLFIAAAGNDGMNTDLTVNYPSGYAVDTIVSVASSTHTDARSSFSNFGAASVDLAAPGSSIYSTIPGGSYATYSGTSMATPHVAGAVALLKSIVPTMSAAEIKARLLSTVDPVAAFASNTVSRGRMNVARLIEESAGPRPVITVTTIEEQNGNNDGINNPGETLALRFTVANRGNESAQNLTARLTSLATPSNFTITESTVSLGTLGNGASIISPTPFIVQSQANLATPSAEEFLITLTHGSPAETSEHRVSIYLHTSARLEGLITDAEDTSPIAGATVRVTGSSTFTTTSGSDGRYSIIVTDGVYEVTASAPGYVTANPVQLSTPPGRSNLNFALGVPQLGLTPPGLNETVYSGRSLTRTIEMRNRGSAPLVWSLELVNGQLAGSAALPITTLPSVETQAHRESPDTGIRAGFKSQEMLTLPAINAPMGALTGIKIGAVSTTWDRSVLISDLEARGAEVITLTLPLTEAALSDLNAVIIDDVIASLGTSDVAMLRDSITAGTGLLCEADNSGSINRINQVLASTGITAVYNGSFTDLTLTDIRVHPMTIGVTTLREVAVGASCTISGSAQTLVGDPSGRTHAAAATLGAGVVVFIGNEISDSSNFATGDGRRFANQIIDGLVSRPSWLAVNPTSGVIQPNATTTLQFQFTPGDLPSATYQATALFTTNVPGEPETRLPVTMNLIDAPRIGVIPGSVAFGSIVQNVAAQQTVRVSNSGRGPLQVSNARLEGADAAHFTLSSSDAFSLASGGTRDLQLTLALDAPLRDLSAELVLVSDDPEQPVFRAGISGARQLPPDIVSSPKNIQLQLKQGQTGSANVILENKGTGPLSWQASLGFRPGQAGISPTWVSLPGVAGDYMPGARGQVRLNFDTGVLSPGDYITTLYIATNDVDTPEVTLPVTLRIIAAPRPIFARSISFTDTLIGGTRRIQVPVQNLGALPFQITSPLALSTSFRNVSPMPFIVPGGATRMLEIEFRPTRVGAVTGSIVFTANVAERYLYIVFSGNGIRGGNLSPLPASLSVSTPPGPNQIRTFKITNTGHLPVNWSASLEGSDAFTLGTPRSGVLTAGSFTTLNMSLLTSQRAAGTYKTKLVILNDTAKPRLEIPLTLTVTRAARLAVTPTPVILDKVWAGRDENSLFLCRNEGNMPLDLRSITVKGTRLTLLPTNTFPHTLAPGASLSVPFRISSITLGDFQDDITIETSVAAQKKVILPVKSKVIAAPTIAVSPASLDETLEPGVIATRELTLSNTGGDTLIWSAIVRDLLGPAATLLNTRANLEANPSSITALLFGAHALTEGTFGNSIVDGGANMFDTGNTISTNLGSSTPLPYEDSGIANHSSVGPNGQYFTRKHGSLWICAADLDGVTRFTISGGLGADGAGSATGGSVTRTVAGVTYRGFFKRVTGTARPSVNHLIIVEDRPGLAHQFETNTDSDFHEVTGLSGSTRLYYLMFGLQNGAVYADNTFGLLMDTFLRRIVHPSAVTWLTPATASGSTSAGSTSTHSLQFDASQLPGGNYSATVRFSSNAPARSLLDVPVILRVPAKSRLSISPAALNFPDTILGTNATLNATLSNPGNLPLTISGLSFDDPAFTISGINLPITLQPKQSVSAAIRFAPTAVRDHPARLVVISDATGVPDTIVNITGRCLRGAGISISPGSVSLTVEPGAPTTQNLLLTNTGGSTLQWTAAPSSGMTGILLFPISSGNVPANETRQVSLQIITTASTLPGTYSGHVRFSSNDISQPILDIPVTIIVPSRPRLAVVPSSVDFGNVFSGGSSSLSVQLRNNGNAALTISSITSDSAAFDHVQSPPLNIGANSSLSFTVRFRPDAITAFTAQMRFTASTSTPSEVTLTLNGRGVQPPAIAVQPGQLSTSLQKGSTTSLPLTVSNSGGATLTWQTQTVDLSTPTGTLQDVLTRVNASHAALTALIPDLYPFTEGTSGTYIIDGGSDMYDGGNYLNTSLGATIAYADNTITSSTKLGTGGSYFTRKHPGLFVFVGDMNGVSSFSTSGNLGADGYGTVSGTTLTRSFDGRNYTGFFKTVSGTTDPSVNHLVIVETKSGISHSFSSNSDNDDHTISGLSGSTRVYYLLFARADGRVVGDTLAGTLMDAFLQSIALPPAAPWITLSPAVGNTFAGSTSTVSVNLNAAPLPIGTHTATVRFTSNAVVNGTVDIPVTLEVTPPVLSVAPESIAVTQLTDGRASTATLTLTARPGTTPAWTATSTAPWLSLSKSSGTGSDSLTLTFASTLTAGSYSGSVNVTFDGITIAVPVSATVRADVFTQLLTDYRQPTRVLGIIAGTGTQSSLLVSLHATTLATQSALTLPADITDADISTDGRWLYALSRSSRTITEVDLDTLAITRTQPIPSSILLSTTSRIEAGRPNRLYYTDGSSIPALHVFDFASATDQSSFLLTGGGGIDEFTITPDGGTIYARSKVSTGSPAYLARISSSSDILVQLGVSASSLVQSIQDTPVFYTANRDAVLTQDTSFIPLLTSSRQYPAQHIIATSAYGQALITRSDIIDASSGGSLQSWPVTVSVAAFTGSQDAVLYYNTTTQQLTRQSLTGIITLPPAAITPSIADGGLIAYAPARLDWTGSPLAASYDVFLGTDPAAVASATNSIGGIYRANTSGISLSVNSTEFLPGQTYYWRIDIRHLDGTTAAGPVWSFRLPAATATPDFVFVSTMAEADPLSKPITLTTASPSTAWTLTENVPWLSLSATSGSGGQTVTLQFNATGLSAGSHVTQLTLTSGSDSVQIMISLRILGTLNIVKMLPDPVLPQVYALHTDTVSNESWLLWIDPATARVQHVNFIGLSITDFTVHALDDRLYALGGNGTTVIAIDRQTTRQNTHSWNPPTTAAAIHNGPAGRIVLRSTTNVLQLHHSVTGGVIGSSISLPTNATTRTPGNGSFIAAALQQSANVTGVARYNISSSAITYYTTHYWTGTYTSTFAISGDGTRAFYLGRVYDATTLAYLFDLATPIQASSWNGLIAWSSTQGYATASGTALSALPFTTTLMAAAADHSRLVLYHPTTRALSSIVPHAVVATPSPLAFSVIPVSPPTSRTLTLQNLTPLDLTYTFASSHTAVTGPVNPFTVNAWQSAQIGITCTPQTTGAITATLTLAATGQSSWDKTIPFTATASNDTVSTIGFEIGAPGAGTSNGVASYTEQGFHFITPASIQRVGPNSTNRPNNSTAHIAPLNNQKPLTITRPGGGTFSLISVDLAEYSGVYPVAKDIPWTGTTATGQTVTTTFRVDGLIDGTGPNADFQTFTFPANFQNLVSASVTIEVYSLDNLTVLTSGASAASTTPSALPSHSITLDTDADGTADFHAQPASTTAAAPGTLLHTLDCRHLPTTDPARLTVQASRDGSTWSDLTPQLDYTWQPTAANPDDAPWQRTQLRIPTAADTPWQFRLLSQP